MTPKEKANELFNKYMPNMYVFQNEFNKEFTKQCALITVDEILKADWYVLNKQEHIKWNEYWQEVKQEIEAL